MAPAAPTLSLTSLSSNMASLAASYPDPYAVYGTEWERKIAGGVYAPLYSGDTGPWSSFDDTSVGDGTPYVWRMRSYNSYFEYSPWSNEVSGTTPLPAPTGVSASANPTSISLSWTDNSQNETNFDVYLDGSLNASTGQNVTSHSISGLSPGQWYSLYVVARNAITSTASATISVFTADPPNAPSGLTLTVTGTTKIRANWTDNAENETGATIEWGTDGVTFGSNATVGANVTTYEITGLTSNTLYYVRVKATNSSGGSAYCTTASAATWAAIAQPTGLKVTPWIAGGLEYVFDDNSELEDDHRIERRINDYVLEKMTDGGLESWAPATGSQTYTSGSGNWTVPAGVTSVDVECWGAGGKGGPDDSTRGGGGGGGGGAYSKKTGIAVTPGASIPYSVGTGATGYDGNGDGNPGGDSTFDTSTVVAKGGGGGKSGANNGAGGAGGSAASGTGDVKYSGGNGGNGYGYADETEGGGGGSGSSAGTAANGGNGGNASGATGGSAGTAPSGGGAGAVGGNHEVDGNAGTAPGGGGSGAGSREPGGGALNGGSGANGKIIISWTGTPTDLMSWTENKAGTSAVYRDAGYGGSGYSARLDVDTSSSQARIYQSSIAIPAGENAKISFRYKSSATGKTLRWYLYCGGAYGLKADGSWHTATYTNTLPNSTDWAQVTIYFLGHSSGSSCSLYFDEGSSTSCSHWIDDVSILTYGAYAEVKTLEPNRTFYRETGLSAGASYSIRVRAKQGASYSSYSSIVTAIVLSTPAAPTGLAVSEYQDTWARLAWTPTTGEAGYRIYQSTDGSSYTLKGTVGKGVSDYKVRVLSASTLYYWKILAYNAAGDSAYTAAVSQTTRSAYFSSAFESLCLMTKKNIFHLIEVNPRMVIAGWALTSGRTYTYEYTISDSGISFDAVFENGGSLSAKTSVTDVEAAAGSFFCDTANKKLYVHASNGGNPTDFLYVGSLWLYFTTYQDGTAVFNDRLYLPLVPEDGVPDISAELSPKWEGGMTLNTGTLTLVNAWLKKAWMFDRNFERYLWTNAKVKILAGGAGFTYSQFYPWGTGTVTEDYALTDDRFTLPLRDTRDSLAGLMLPISFYTATDFPLADTGILNTRRPFAFGVITGAVPKCLDTTNRVFEFHAGRIKSVEAVYKNDVALALDTDFFVDQQHGRITLARGLSYTTSDKITVDFTGAVDESDTAIKNGALIFLYALQYFAGLMLTDIDLDSVYETAEGSSLNLAYYLYTDRSFGEFVARLERSLLAFTYQDGRGRIGFKTSPTSAPSNILYVEEPYISDFSMRGGKGSRYREIQVCYGEDAAAQKFQYATAMLNTMTWKYGVQGTLDVETALTNLADAQTLRASIIALLDRPVVSMTIKRRIYTAEVGDLIYMTRGRYYSQEGTASNKLLRILSIGKAVGGNITVTAEEV